jgi:hypothetical protein
MLQNIIILLACYGRRSSNNTRTETHRKTLFHNNTDPTKIYFSEVHFFYYRPTPLYIKTFLVKLHVLFHKYDACVAEINQDIHQFHIIIGIKSQRSLVHSGKINVRHSASEIMKALWKIRVDGCTVGFLKITYQLQRLHRVE